MLSRILTQLPRAASSSLLRLPLHAARQCPRRILSNYVQSHQRRTYATPPPQVNESSIPIELYHEQADKTMDRLLEQMEELLDGEGVPSYEVEYHSGVLTLNLGSHGTYVINKQPPNKQIWLSSPVSGPKRYDYTEDNGYWVYGRDGKSMNSLLSEELTSIFGREIDVSL